MGIIVKQTFFNLFSIGIGFLVGALNILFLYPIFLGDTRQGLVAGLLAVSNLVQPFLSMGLQHALIKFFSTFTDPREKDAFLWFVILAPLLLIALLGGVYFLYPEGLTALILGETNSTVSYLTFIVLIAISTAYFEIFNSWLRVHLKSVFANFLKELYPRLLISILIGGFALGVYSFQTFMYALVAGYYFRLVLVIGYSLWMHRPSWQGYLPSKIKAVLRYSVLIFLSGAAASFILDIDKAMLLSFSKEEVAYYTVAIYIAAVIEAPGRALYQIISPILARSLHENDTLTVTDLLKKSSSNLLMVSGAFFLLISLNLTDFYQLLDPKYQAAIGVVQLVSLGKLYSMSLGCLNQIISNSDFYSYVLVFSIFSAVLAVILNMYCIPRYGLMGAAYATLAVLLCINTLKVGLLQWKMQIHPFSSNTLKILLSIGVVLGVFRWIELPFVPWVNIGLQSALIGISYLGLLYSMGSLQPVVAYLRNRKA